jgi:TldD protein
MRADQATTLAQALMAKAPRAGAAFADVRIGRSELTHAMVQDTRADRLAESVAMGAGIRVLANEAWGFAGTDDLSAASLEDMLAKAVAMARASSDHVLDKGCVADVPALRAVETVSVEIDPRSVPLGEKMSLLLALERAALDACGPVIVNSVLSYSDGAAWEVLASTAGTLIERQLSRCSVSCHFVASDGKIFQRSGESYANRAGFELLRDMDPEATIVKAAKVAKVQLAAKRPPAGNFPVVFHPSVTGLLMHEALGHNAEADAVWAGESILAGRMGDTIASAKVTVIDDATYPNSYGSYAYDSEGVRAVRRVLIENGVLKGYLHNLETAKKFGVAPNGSGRAQNFMYRPIVRMSNTFMAPGADAVANIFKGIGRGVYLKDGSWGYVFVDKGQFVCHATQAQMIENGKLGEPLRDVSVSGMMLETLMDIEAVADDFEMDKPGMCGKGGQSAPVNCGGPHVRVKTLVVGGV